MIRDCVCKRARHVHGTARAYQSDKCRCFSCRVAHANAVREYRNGGSWKETDFRSSAGVRRRLQALAVIGHNAAAIAQRTGLTVDYVSKLRTDRRHPKIRASMYQLIADVYDELWDKPDLSPSGRRCSTQASRLRYVPPLAWDDETIDNPKARPQHMLTAKVKGKHGDVVARAEHVAVLTRAGLTAREIADRLGTTPRNVSRDRARTREAAA